MKNRTKKNNKEGQPLEEKDDNSTEHIEQDSEIDPLEVVIEDEEDLGIEKDTEDDMFDDDELNLNPSLDNGER